MTLGGEALSDVRTRLVRRGDVLAEAGRPAAAGYAVLSGRLGNFSHRCPDRSPERHTSTSLSPPGDQPVRARLQEILGPGQRARVVEVLAPEESPSASVECLTNGVVAVIDARLIRRWCERPEIALQVLRDFAAEREALERRRSVWSELDVTARLAVVVLELYERYGSVRVVNARPVAVVSHGLSQAYLGDLIGARRETVNRATRALEAEGLLSLTAHGVMLPDLEGLARRAGRRGQSREQAPEGVRAVS